MKNIIYTILVIGLVFVGAVTAQNLMATDHDHNATSSTVIDHSGGTDSAGCHHNRKTGGYHCH